MKQQPKININNTPYPLKYGYGALKILGEQWDLPGMMEVFKKILSLLPSDENQDPENIDLDEIDELVTTDLLQFEKIDLMADIILAGVINADYGKPANDIDAIADGDIQDALFADFSILSVAFAELFKAMPKGEKPAPVKKKPRATAPKKRRK